MKRWIVCFLIISSVLVGIVTLAYVQRNEMVARANSSSPSPTPPATEDIPPVRKGAATIIPPPLWANEIKNQRVKYVASSSLTTFPVPAVIFRREALARQGDWTEIREKIIYPAVNKSEQPVAAVVVEYFRDRTDIGVTLIWYGVGPTGRSNYSSAAIERDASGHFPTDSYLSLFSKDEE